MMSTLSLLSLMFCLKTVFQTHLMAFLCIFNLGPFLHFRECWQVMSVCVCREIVCVCKHEATHSNCKLQVPKSTPDTARAPGKHRYDSRCAGENALFLNFTPHALEFYSSEGPLG